MVHETPRVHVAGIGRGGVRVDQLQKVELADGELGMMMSVTIDVRSGLPTQQMKLLLQIGTNYYEVLAVRTCYVAKSSRFLFGKTPCTFNDKLKGVDRPCLA